MPTYNTGVCVGKCIGHLLLVKFNAVLFSLTKETVHNLNKENANKLNVITILFKSIDQYILS
jgi:hypothetical protein